MLLTQLLSASTLAVPVWAHSTYISNNDPGQQRVHGNLQFIDDPATTDSQPQNILAVDLNSNNNNNQNPGYPYSPPGPQQQQHQFLRHHQVEEYTKVVNSNAYIIQGGGGGGANDGKDIGRRMATSGDKGGGGRGSVGRPGQRKQPERMANQSKANGQVRRIQPPAIPGQRSGSAGPSIVKKSWPAQSSLQTKSLTRNNVHESFNRNYFITSRAERPPIVDSNNGDGGGVADVAIRTVTKDVTNVRTESAWDRAAVPGVATAAGENGMWPMQQWVHEDRDDVFMVGVYGEDGVNRGVNGVDPQINGVRVGSARNPYATSEGGGGGVDVTSVHVMENVSNDNNNYSEFGKKESRVDASGRFDKSGVVKGVYTNSANGGTRNVTRPGAGSRESVSGSNIIRYQEGVTRADLAKSPSSAVAGLGVGGSDGDIATDFWNTYGYKLALVTAAGVIGFLAFLGVVRCLRGGISGSSSGTGNGGDSTNNSSGGNSGSRGIRSAGLALSTSLLSEDRTPLNAGSPYSVPMLSVQSPGYAGMERLGVPVRSSTSSSSAQAAAAAAASPSVVAGLHHKVSKNNINSGSSSSNISHHHRNLDDDDGDDDGDVGDSSSSISRNANQLTAGGCNSSRRTQMAPQRDYLSGQQSQQGKCGDVNQRVEGSSSGLDVKLYVALESSSASSGSSLSSPQPRSHYNNSGYNREEGDPGRPRIGGSEMNNGRCPHHVKLGDSEWGNVDRPANIQNRVPYQAELTRTYIKPPPNKTALDVPDRDNNCAGGGGVYGGSGGGSAAAAAMASRNSNSNLLNFPYAHGMSASQEALSSSSSNGVGAASSSGVSKSASSSKQSNFPFSRFFKGRGTTNSSSSINHGNGHGAKSRPESPCRYVATSGASKSTSAVGNTNQQQQLHHHNNHHRLPLSGSSISLASPAYANSGLADTGDSASTGEPGMVVDVTSSSSSTNYCVFVTASASDVSSSERYRYRSTTTRTTKHLSPCDTNREFDLNGSSSASASAAVVVAAPGASLSSNLRHSSSTSSSGNSFTHTLIPNNSSCNSHHSKGAAAAAGYGDNSRDVVVVTHSINSYQTSPHLAPLHQQQQQQQQHHRQHHQTVSNNLLASSQSPPIMQCVGGGGDNGSGSCARVDSAATASSCDKRVYVEKRIKTSDSESTDSSTCSGGGGGSGHRQSAGFKGMDADQSV